MQTLIKLYLINSYCLLCICDLYDFSLNEQCLAGCDFLPRGLNWIVIRHLWLNTQLYGSPEWSWVETYYFLFSYDNEFDLFCRCHYNDDIIFFQVCKKLFPDIFFFPCLYTRFIFPRTNVSPKGRWINREKMTWSDWLEWTTAHTLLCGVQNKPHKVLYKKWS